MKNTIYGIFIALALNTALIAMDPLQVPWWHNGKSGLCQLYRGIGFGLVKDLESKIAPAVLGNNQWWYCSFKVSHNDRISPPVALSNDGKLMAVAVEKIVRFYDTITGFGSMCFGNTASVNSMSFRDKFMIGTEWGVEILDSDLKTSLAFELYGDFESVDFNSKMVVVKEAGNKDIAFYDKESGKELAFVRKDFPEDFLPAHKIDLVSLTDDKLVVASSRYGGIQVYDLATKKRLMSSKQFCRSINLRRNLLAVASRGVELYNINVELYNVETNERLMFFKPRKSAYSISLSDNGNSLAVGLMDDRGCMTDLFLKHDNCTLEQLQLKHALCKWLQLEKPDKNIIEGEASGILEKLFTDVSKKCELDYDNECDAVWLTFPLKMQNALFRTMQHRIEKHGK